MARIRSSNCFIPVHRGAELRIVAITVARDDTWTRAICSAGIMDKQLQGGGGGNMPCRSVRRCHVAKSTAIQCRQAAREREREGDVSIEK
jgi:hypothetical protein